MPARATQATRARAARAPLRRALPRLVTANLLRPLLLELAARLEHAPAHLIAGGLLAHEADEVADAFARRGLIERRRRHGGEWAALWLGAG